MSTSSDESSRLGRVYRLQRENGFALISPLVAQGDRPIFLHVTSLDESTWRKLKVGTWLLLTIEDGPKGPRANAATITHPDPIDL